MMLDTKIAGPRRPSPSRRGRAEPHDPCRRVARQVPPPSSAGEPHQPFRATGDHNLVLPVKEVRAMRFVSPGATP